LKKIREILPIASPVFLPGFRNAPNRHFCGREAKATAASTHTNAAM